MSAPAPTALLYQPNGKPWAKKSLTEALEFNQGLSSDNTAVGAEALQFNTDGSPNTAIGHAALNNYLMTGANTTVGYDALFIQDSGPSLAVDTMSALQDSAR